MVSGWTYETGMERRYESPRGVLVDHCQTRSSCGSIETELEHWLMMPLSGERKRRICYFFDSDIGNYHYGPGHPMKPHRIRMTHALVMNYGLYKKMEIFRAKPATRKEMAQFHTDDYVEFLSKVTPDNMEGFLKEQAKFNLGDDCPVFDGLFEYCSISAGGSMEGAARLSRDKCDIAVNWAGGLHHAKKAEANGFCYVNDIVLGILELLRYHKRVLYVDIDVHHGDGVEEAFYTTDRVMTCSFHKYGEFFPGTGELRDVGSGKGKRYAVNFPLRDGITDEAYKNIFEPVILKIMETYQPSAIVLQCGGDSLAGDRLGSFNVSLRGHANCVQFIKNLGLPLLLLGGGGYTIRNVSRTWAFETGLAAGQELCREIPMNEYYEYFGPTYHLDVPASNMEDMNVQQYLEKVKVQIFENLRHTIPVPSVEMQPIPRLPHDDMEIDEDLDDPNERRPQRLLDALVQRDDEFSDSEDEGEGGRTNNQSQRRPRKVPRTVLDANRSRLASGSLIQQNFAPGPNGTSHAARETRRPLPAAANIVSNGTNGVASADVSMDSNTVALDQSLVVAESNPRGGPLVRDEADRMELETMAANLVEEVNQAVSNSTPATSAVPQQVESAIEERIGMTQTGQPDTNVPQSDEGHKMQIDPPLEVTQEHIPIPIFSDGPSATAPDHSELTKPAPSVEEHDLRPTAKAISVVSSLVSEVEMSDSQSFPSAPSSEPTVNASDRSPQRFSNPHMSLSDVNELQQILDATDTDVGLNTTDPSLQADNARVMMPTEPTNAPLNVGSHNPSERSFGLSGTPQPPQQIPPLSHEAQIPVTSIINPQSSTASNKLVEQPELHSNPTLVDAEQSAARHGNLLTDPHSAKPNLHPLSNDHHQSTRVEQPIVSAVIPGLKILDHLPNAPTASPSINTSQDPLTPQSIAPAILSDHLPPPSPTQSQEAPNRHLVSSNRQITSNAPSSDTTGPTQLSPNWNSSINPSLVPVPPTRLSAGVVPATTITEVPAKAVASQASSQVDMSKGDSRLPWRAMSVEEEMNRMIEQQQRTQMGVSTNDSRNLSSVLTTSGTHPQTNSTGTNATKTESIHPKSSVHHVEPTLTQSSAGPSVIEMDPQLKPMSVSASIHPSITTNPVVSSAPLHVNVPAPMPGTSGDALEAQRGINVAAENTELCTPTIHSGSIDPAIKGSLPTHRGLPQ